MLQLFVHAWRIFELVSLDIKIVEVPQLFESDEIVDLETAWKSWLVIDRGQSDGVDEISYSSVWINLSKTPPN